MECWLYRKRDRGSRRVQDTFLVSSTYMEPIVARPEIRIDGLAASSHVLPFPVKSVEPIVKLHRVRRGKGQRGVVDFDSRCERRESEGCVTQEALSVCADFFDADVRWDW